MTPKSAMLAGKAPDKMLPHFQKLESALAETGQQRREIQRKLAQLDEDQKISDAVYIRDVIKPGRAMLEDAKRILNERSSQAVRDILQEMGQVAAAKHTLNLNDSALQVAINAISGGAGKNLAIRQQINQALAGNQAALKLARAMYENQGINVSEMDNLMYEPDTFEYLANESASILARGGSVNAISARLAPIASKEGIDFPATADPDSAVTAMREAAGLPVVEP